MNVIFIVVDTLRKDHAGPLESRLRKLGFIPYGNVVAPAPWTVPSHASIFTGLYPALHKAHETREKKGFDIKLRHGDLLSKLLLDKGYDTYLLTANSYIRPSLGFRGFNHFYENPGWSPPKLSLLSYDDWVLLVDLKLKHGISDRKDLVKLLGFVPDDELYLWMNSADVFVLPSLSESFCIVQFEAMAVGSPVVATYNGWQ